MIQKHLNSTHPYLKNFGFKNSKNSNPIAEAQRILLAGIGEKENLTQDTIRFVSGKIAQKARELKLKEFSIITPPTFVIDSISAVSQIIEGTKMSLYKFDKFKTEKVDKSPDMTIIVSKSNKISKTIKIAEAAKVIENTQIYHQTNVLLQH